MENKKYLTEEGFTVYTSADPIKGIEYAKKDVIVLSVSQPAMQ